MSSGLRTETVTGAALADYLDELARLRITVFREYPYLYDGDPEYERAYLATYFGSSEAMAVLAFDDGAVVGASTGIPMANESDAFKKPFINRGIDPETVFYCGESVLLAPYRGRGLYKTFFKERESYAVSLERFDTICFCGVVRPPDHPLRPSGYEPLDAVWRHFGYRPEPDLLAHYSWKDVDQADPTDHPMMFWLKPLVPAP